VSNVALNNCILPSPTLYAYKFFDKILHILISLATEIMHNFPTYPSYIPTLPENTLTRQKRHVL